MTEDARLEKHRMKGDDVVSGKYVLKSFVYFLYV